jgi:RNA polymerase sigma factor (TIGR02999 family)
VDPAEEPRALSSVPARPGEAELVDQEFARRLYEEVRRLASRELRREGRGHTLQTTALAHEAWIRLGADFAFPNRPQFIGAAVSTIRRVLIDHARHRRVRRSAEQLAIEWDRDSRDTEPAASVDLIALDEALQKLAGLDPRQARVIELRYFGGLSIDETAAALSISSRTVDAAWHAARAWLARELHPGP